MSLPLVTAIHPEMLVALLGIGAEALRTTLMSVAFLVLAVSVHEFSHAFAAHKLGDPTPEGQGRLTLNPLAHVDPIGTLALPIIMGLSMGAMFGWGRPVEHNPRYFKRSVTMRAGTAIVAFAGPLSNLLMATLTLALAAALAHFAGLSAWLVGNGRFTTNPVWMFFSLNVLLFVFNLLPIHPLDGGKVLGWILGVRRQHVDEFLARYGFMILVGLMVSGVLGYVIDPFISLAAWAYLAVVV